MAALIVFLVFVSVTIAAFSLVAAAYAPSSVIGSRLRDLGAREPAQQTKAPIRERFQKALDPLARAVPMSASDASRTRLLLIQAGYRDPRSVTLYFGIRSLLALTGLAIVLLSGAAVNSPLLILGIPALGFLLPRFVLKRRISARQHRIRLALPDALDLTVICIEAGLSLDQAMMRVGEDLKHVHPDLNDEFRLLNLEMRAGKPRVEAFRNLANRTGVDDVRALVATLVQTDRFGTSVTQALRVHSDSLRTERRQRAEEQAAKTTIKMVPPLVFFVLPSIVFVTLGPAVIQLIRTLMPATR
jgi:tight adherence protein C